MKPCSGLFCKAAYLLALLLLVGRLTAESQKLGRRLQTAGLNGTTPGPGSPGPTTGTPTPVPSPTSPTPPLPAPSPSNGTALSPMQTVPSLVSLLISGLIGLICCVIGILKRRQFLRTYEEYLSRRRGERRYALEDSFLETGGTEWCCSICCHFNHPLKKACVMCGTTREFVEKTIAEEEATSSTVGQSSVKGWSGRNAVLSMVKGTQGKESPVPASLTTIRKCGLYTLNSRQRSSRDRFQFHVERTQTGWRWRRSDIFEQMGKLLSIKTDLDSVKPKEPKKSQPDFNSASKSLPLLEAVREDLARMEEGAISKDPPKEYVPAFWLKMTKEGECKLVDLEEETPDADLRKLEEFDIYQYHSFGELSSFPFKQKSKWLFRQTTKWVVLSHASYVEITVDRDHILRDSMQLLELPPSIWRQRLRVKFLDELGYDAGGLLREWYTVLNERLFSQELGLFCATRTEEGGYWINPASGTSLPDHLKYFRFVGRLLGKAILENQLFTVNFAVPLLKHLIGYPVTIEDLVYVDEEFYNSLLWLRDNYGAESLCLDFSMQESDGNGGSHTVELTPGGADIAVTDANKAEYIDLVIKYKLFGAVAEQLSAMVDGFKEITPDELYLPFDYKELELLVCGVREIDVKDWKEHTDVFYIDPTAPMRQEELVLQWFWEEMEAMSEAEKAKFLQFTTGSTKVPLEGFKALTSHDGRIKRFAIHTVRLAGTADAKFPRAHTCFNRLDLPLYSSKEELHSYLSMVLDMEITGFTMM